MKKLCLCALSVALVGFAIGSDEIYAAREYQRSSAVEHPNFPILVSLATPLQLPSKNYSVTGLRWNILYGSCYRVLGLDFGLVGYSQHNLVGLSLQGVDWVGGEMMGVQISALGNVVLEESKGIQVSAFCNYNKGAFYGYQGAMVNHNVNFNGVQVGSINWNSGLSYGLQIGVANANVAEFNGWSEGFINWSDTMVGLQLGCFNIATTSATGVQIGFINAASTMSGIQIGALNLIGDAVIPVLPIVNGNF